MDNNSSNGKVVSSYDKIIDYNSYKEKAFQVLITCLNKKKPTPIEAGRSSANEKILEK
jgi:hypothetical protein